MWCLFTAFLRAKYNWFSWVIHCLIRGFSGMSGQPDALEDCTYSSKDLVSLDSIPSAHKYMHEHEVANQIRSCSHTRLLLCRLLEWLLNLIRLSWRNTVRPIWWADSRLARSWALVERMMMERCTGQRSVFVSFELCVAICRVLKNCRPLAKM